MKKQRLNTSNRPKIAAFAPKEKPLKTDLSFEELLKKALNTPIRKKKN
jgi:hypothetical protein